MKSDESFGALLIRHTHDASQASMYKVGTLAKITDFYQGSDGLLGVTAKGGQRFRLISSEHQKNGLNVGEIELIEAERSFVLPPEFELLPKCSRMCWKSLVDCMKGKITAITMRFGFPIVLLKYCQLTSTKSKRVLRIAIPSQD